ncbi:MAG: barstar family protein [bacterium]|nr:barstar family protein [bacterium]
MSHTSFDFLYRSEPPWIYAGPGEPDRLSWNPIHFYSPPGEAVCVRRLRGWKMRTTTALMNEFGAALQLFDGFGENWYALEECLSYLDEWLPATAYVLVVERAEEVLADEPVQLEALLTTINAAAESWSRAIEDGDRFDRAPVPFHLLLNVSGGHESAELAILRAAEDSGVALRRA